MAAGRREPLVAGGQSAGAGRGFAKTRLASGSAARRQRRGSDRAGAGGGCPSGLFHSRLRAVYTASGGNAARRFDGCRHRLPAVWGASVSRTRGGEDQSRRAIQGIHAVLQGVPDAGAAAATAHCAEAIALASNMAGERAARRLGFSAVASRLGGADARILDARLEHRGKGAAARFHRGSPGGLRREPGPPGPRRHIAPVAASGVRRDQPAPAVARRQSRRRCG